MGWNNFYSSYSDLNALFLKVYLAIEKGVEISVCLCGFSVNACLSNIVGYVWVFYKRSCNNIKTQRKNQFKVWI